MAQVPNFDIGLEIYFTKGSTARKLNAFVCSYFCVCKARQACPRFLFSALFRKQSNEKCTLHIYDGQVNRH